MVSDSLLSCPESSGFLIDGFPRKLEQAKELERIVSVPTPQCLWVCVPATPLPTPLKALMDDA